MRQGIKNIIIVLLAMLLCVGIATVVSGQEDIRTKDSYEKRIGFVEDEIYLGSQVIAHTSVEMVVNDKKDTTYYFLLKRHGEHAAFAIPDITDVLDAILVLNNREESGEYIGDNLFVLGKNEYQGRKDWYMILNAETSRKFYFITNINMFKYNMQQAAIALIDYMYGYERIKK